MQPCLIIYDHTSYPQWGPVYLANMKPDKTASEVDSQFLDGSIVVKRITLDENKADLAWFLSDVIMIKGKDQPEWYEMVTGGGFINATDARPMRRDQSKLTGKTFLLENIPEAPISCQRSWSWWRARANWRYMTHRNSQPSTMPDFSCLVRLRRVWRCCLQLEMPLTYQRCSSPSCHHGLEEGCRMSDSSLDKTLHISDPCVKLLKCSCKLQAKI